MKLTKAQKKDKAQELAQELQGASCLYFTNYQGLKFAELYQLRTRLKPLGGRYQVVKNSLVRNALRYAGLSPQDDGVFKGPIGLVVAKSADAVQAAKVLAQFAKDFPQLKFRAAFVPPQWMPGSDVVRLASLPGKTELLGRLANALYGTAAGIAAVLQAPIRDLALVLQALEDKKKSETGGAPVTAA